MLHRLKDALSAEFDAEDTYIFIIDEMKLYTASNDLESYQLLAEVSKEEVAIFVISAGGDIVTQRDIPLEGTVNQSVRKWMESRYSTTRFAELPLLTRVESIYGIAQCTLIVREKEETRGGEYIEFGYLLGKIGDRYVNFFSKSGIKLSTMVKELLTDARIPNSTYDDETHLSREAVRAARHAFEEDARPSR